MENILLKSNGYCKIGCDDLCCDFINSKKNRWDRINHGQIKNFIYAPPEFFTCLGTTYSYDFWCLGISIFKMLTNEFPFLSDNSICDNLVPDIANKDVSIEAKNLISNLLVKDPSERLGIRIIDKKFKYDPFYNQLVLMFLSMKVS